MRQRGNAPRLTPIAAVLLAIGVTAGTVQAATSPAPAFVPAWATDTDADADPNDAGTNALTVDAGSQEGKTYIYPNPTDRQTDEEGASDGTGSVAYISWLLDNATGRAPGIQTVTDDTTFSVNNCIMASGEYDDGTPKTCSDAQGSSKRYKLAVTSADTAVDLVFDTRTLDMTYDDAIDTDDDGIDAGEDTVGGTPGDGRVDTGDVEVGRIYRVLQKLLNDTGERIQSVRLELGYYTSPATRTGFQKFIMDDIGFELRTEVERTFFGQDSTNMREVWKENEFAEFSPAMFEEPTAAIPAGFFDDNPGGLFPPEGFEAGTNQSQYIDSGDTITGNYFDLPANQGAVADVVIPGNVFGYLLPESQLPKGIYEYPDGLDAEGDLLAWWDGNDWRYGLADNFAIVPDAQLTSWAGQSDVAIAEIDDLRSLNMDFYIYMGDDFLADTDSDGVVDTPRYDQVVLRITANSIAADTVDGTATPDWDANPAPALSTYVADSDTSTAVGGGGGGGCTIGGNRPFDPLMPGLALAALGYLGLRRRWNA